MVCSVHFSAMLQGAETSIIKCHDCERPTVDLPKDKCEDAAHYKKLVAGDNCSCHWECSACSICGVNLNLFLNYEKQPCTDVSDTVCCKDSDMSVIEGQCTDVSANSASTATTVLETSTTKTGSTASHALKHQTERLSSNSCHVTRSTSMIRVWGFSVVALLSLRS